jgi:phosphoribosylcarboxyaminoimidazole (NCAIR) mutase
MRKIAVMIGSDSDLSQCENGLKYLLEAEKEGLVEVVKVITNSIHRNTHSVLDKLFNFHTAVGVEIDAIIVGAGMANHLTGTVDAYLRYTLGNKRIIVVGVAFIGKTEAETRVARESIIYVPGTQVVFNEYIGANGFMRACEFAVEGDLPRRIILKEGKPVVERTLEEAIKAAEEKLKEKGGK